MGKSGNPAKAAREAEALKISQIGDFKKRLGGLLELPSGAVVKVRNPGGMRVFLDSGMIPNSLMKIIQDGLDKGKPAAPGDIVKDGKIDPAMLTDMMTMMDNIAIKVIVEPPVMPALTEMDLIEWNTAHPEESLDTVEQLRSEDKLYVDEFPDEDKMFIFQWVSGGTKDLETFRQQHAAGVDAISAVAGSGDNAE